jgi:hypothetical protein
VAEEIEKEKADLEKELEKNNVGLTDIRSEHTDEKTLETEINSLTE